jgi:hypothetical protein
LLLGGLEASATEPRCIVPRRFAGVTVGHGPQRRPRGPRVWPWVAGGRRPTASTRQLGRPPGGIGPPRAGHRPRRAVRPRASQRGPNASRLPTIAGRVTDAPSSGPNASRPPRLHHRDALGPLPRAGSLPSSPMPSAGANEPITADHHGPRIIAHAQANPSPQRRRAPPDQRTR